MVDGRDLTHPTHTQTRTHTNTDRHIHACTRTHKHIHTSNNGKDKISHIHMIAIVTYSSSVFYDCLLTTVMWIQFYYPVGYSIYHMWLP